MLIFNRDMRKEPQMEDQDYISFPFEGDSSIGVFAIFDGHVDKNCAIAAKNMVGSVIFRICIFVF